MKLNNCTDLVDLSPLEEAWALTGLTLPPFAKKFEFLRGFPKLERLSYAEDSGHGWRPDKTVAEFWKEYDAIKK